MISYWKNWWFHFAVGIVHLVACLYFLATDQDLVGVGQLICGLYWIGSSVIINNRENIKELNERLQKVEEHAITDLDSEGNGNYIARRRCGPDKDVPYPDEEPTIEERIEVSDKTFTYLKTSQDVLGFVPAESESLTLTGQQLKAIAFKVWEDKK
jgi:hypothetical protein